MRRFSREAAALAAMVLGALEAGAQQTIDFPAGQIPGTWANGGCGTNDERGSSTPGTEMTLAWNDTTGIAQNVQIEIRMAWKFFVDNSGYTLRVNGADVGPGATPQPSSTCNATPYATTSTVIAAGTFAYNAGGPNVISILHANGGWIGVQTNAQGWAIRVVVTPLNQEPLPPTSLAQLGPDGKGILVGGTCPGTTVRMRATVNDPDTDDVHLEAEFTSVLQFFTGLPTHAGAPAPSGGDASVEATSLAAGLYHWQVRTVDPFDLRSTWVPFGANSEVLADVVVDPKGLTPPPLSAGNRAAGDCSISTGAGRAAMLPTLVGLLLLAAAARRFRHSGNG